MRESGALLPGVADGHRVFPRWLDRPLLTILGVARRAGRAMPGLACLERLLDRRWIAPFIVALTSCLMWFAWGTLRHIPFLQDEAAYVLQASEFAAGRWADPSPPLPAFFEQPHVLVTPTLAAKYPPGHSLLMAPGFWVHRPGLVPILLLGLTGGLLFALGRDVLRERVGAWAAVLAWIGWVGLVGHESWPRPSYMSEITTTSLWLAGWWALLRWRDQRRLGHLLLVAACVGWGAITRPLTMLAYAIPVGMVVLVLVARRRLWRQLAAGVAVGVAILAIIPLWSARTTGDWRQTPLSLYTRQYFPWDVPGFGMRDDKPLRPAPAEIACFKAQFGESHRGASLRAVPPALWSRLRWLLADTFSGWRVAIAPFGLLGLVLMPLELGVAAATCGLLLLAYLAYPHDPRYTIYYMEAQPTIVLLAAFGLCACARAVGVWWGRRKDPTAARQDGGRPLVARCAIALLLAAVLPTWAAVNAVRNGHQVGDLGNHLFRSTVDSLPDSRVLVFVRYAPDQACGQNMIQNEPPLSTARAWIVYDRGLEDEQLVRLAPDRKAYLFDAKTGRIEPYRPPTSALR